MKQVIKKTEITLDAEIIIPESARQKQLNLRSMDRPMTVELPSRGRNFERRRNTQTG